MADSASSLVVARQHVQAFHLSRLHFASSLFYLVVAAFATHQSTAGAAVSGNVTVTLTQVLHDALGMPNWGGDVVMDAAGLVVAVPSVDDPFPTGSLYVYERTNTSASWQLVTKLVPPKPDDYYGYYLSISADGSTIQGAGSANDCIFKRNGTSWAVWYIDGDWCSATSHSMAKTLHARATASDRRRGTVPDSHRAHWQNRVGGAASFGHDECVLNTDGTMYATALPCSDPSCTGALVAQRAASGAWTWFQSFPGPCYYYPGNESLPVELGDSIALSSNDHTLLIGCIDAVAHYELINGSWERYALYMAPPEVGHFHQFGQVITISGDASTVALSAVIANNTGAVVVYTFNSTGYMVQHSTLWPSSNDSLGEVFGASMMFSYDASRLVVSSPCMGYSNPNDEAGVVRLYIRNSSAQYEQAAEWYAPDPSEWAQFGSAVAIDASGTHIMVVNGSCDDGDVGTEVYSYEVDVGDG